MRLTTQITCFLFALLLLVTSNVLAAGEPAPGGSPLQPIRFYVGTYTGTKATDSKGIYQYHLDVTTGAVTADGLAVESSSPSFLALAPNGKFLYAANEAGKAGVVSAY